MRRKNELSFLNIIFCLLVILIHVLSSPVTGLTKGTWQYCAVFIPWRLSAFVVQGFIFLSGLKMFLTKKEENYFKYCWSRFVKIVFPYVAMVAVFYAYFISHQYFGFSISDLWAYIIKGDLVSHFYFVIIIVQFYLLKPLWKIMIEKVLPVVAVIFSVFVMFFFKNLLSEFLYNDRILTSYLTYWVLGCYVGANFEGFSQHIRKYKLVYIFQFIIIALVETIVSYKHFVVGGIKFLEELHFVYCISAIFCMYAIATVIGDKVMNFKLARKVDNASYYIYLIHPLFIFITDDKLYQRGVQDIGTAFIVRFLVTYVLAIVISVVYLELKGMFKRKIACLNTEKQK